MATGSYFPPSGAALSLSPPVSSSASPLSPPAQQRSNALSNRLTSVLSVSYADSDIRDALETLSDRGIHNTAEVRRQLRLDVQKEVVDCNAEVVRDFGHVAEQLERIGTVISSLKETCNEMRKHIVSAKQDTVPVLEEASALLSQKEEAETKQHLLDAFTKHFIVSDNELLILTSVEEPINDEFFDVLARVKQVHRDCEALLGAESDRLGLELMEKSSRSLSSAYQKLYRWIQKEFKSLNLEDSRISSTIRRALRVLAERPSLFHSCLDFFAEARDYLLSDAFHYALTDAVSGGDSAVKPIEFSAHDPLRYIGDMLAWVHSATVSEREALESLFVADGDELAKGIKAGLSSEPWARIDEDEEVTFDGQRALSDLVNRDLIGVARSLRQRVELVIQGHDDPVTCYKVVNLLGFYQVTFSKLVGPSSNLAELIQTLETFTLNHFQTITREEVNKISTDKSALALPEDLAVPQFLLDALDVLTSLMKTHDASVGLDNTSDEKENKFTPVLRAALDPFLDLAKSCADELLNSTARAIFLANIYLTTRSTIAPFSFASATHLTPLSTSLSSIRIELLEIQHRYLLETSGLQVLLTALEPFSKTSATSIGRNISSIVDLPEFQPEALIAISQQLDDFLPSALMDATDNLKCLQSAAFVKSVTEEAVEAFCRDFEFVEGMVLGADEARNAAKTSAPDEGESEESRDEGADDQSIRRLFPRTTGEIRVLLS
ncbi:oligomeric Golgi complex subunit 6 [Aspergillus heterothallicus]